MSGNGVRKDKGKANMYVNAWLLAWDSHYYLGRLSKKLAGCTGDRVG